jgi:hypothetical protein
MCFRKEVRVNVVKTTRVDISVTDISGADIDNGKDL